MFALPVWHLPGRVDGRSERHRREISGREQEQFKATKEYEQPIVDQFEPVLIGPKREMATALTARAHHVRYPVVEVTAIFLQTFLQAEDQEIFELKPESRHCQLCAQTRSLAHTCRWRNSRLLDVQVGTSLTSHGSVFSNWIAW